MSTAIIDGTGRYRYSLTRTWDANLPIAVFVMLNPSTADASVNDPTIVRCVNFAKRDEFGSIVVVNLYALRSTDPINVRRDTATAIGYRNDEITITAASDADRTDGKVIVAWGPKPWARGRIRHVQTLLLGRHLWCLGTAKDGSPRHPLMVRNDQALVRWER